MLQTSPPDRLMARLRQAFMDYGYGHLTMVGLADACDVTRRALYHHFNGKEEAFREMIRWGHGSDIKAGFEAGDLVLAQGGSALDVVVEIMDVRYGRARRALAESPHAVEINYEAFRRCRELMIESAVVFQDRLAALLANMGKSGLLRVRAEVTPGDLAQLLADGARGVNQSLPPLPVTGIRERYRIMFAAILYGCTDT